MQKTTCPHCKIEFEKNRKDKVFCSRGCKQRFRNKLLNRGSSKQRKYKKYKSDKCNNCGFIPLHTCQLDVDHIDGDHNNNSPDNLQTLCANCHRLKTYLNEDWKSE
jgi:hypothetical protein